MTEEICRRLRFSNEATKQIAALVANHMKFKDVPKMKQSTLKKFVRLPEFSQHLELHRLDCGASHGKLDIYNEVKQFVETTPPEEVRPERLLNGDDLQQMGYSAGPQFQRMLASLEDAQLEGAVRTREEAAEFVQRNYPLPGEADKTG